MHAPVSRTRQTPESPEPHFVGIDAIWGGFTSKRQGNLRDHGLDFVGIDAIWGGFTVTRKDLRQSYGEVRLVTFGILEGVVVVLVHTDRDEEMHVISLRKAEPYEARYYLEAVEEYFQGGRGP